MKYKGQVITVVPLKGQIILELRAKTCLRMFFNKILTVTMKKQGVCSCTVFFFGVSYDKGW